MKVFIALSVFLAAVVAKPSVLVSPGFYAAPAPIVSQYHSQDELGQYSYGYSGGLSAKVESKTFDGVTRGSYSYVDADGKLQTVQYTADAVNGFRAAATNLPKGPVDKAVAPEPVQDTPEVAKAKEEHFAAFSEAATRAAVEPEQPAVVEVQAPASVAPFAPVVAYTAAEYPAYAYTYRSPAFAYSTGPYFAPYQFAAPYTAPYAGPYVAHGTPFMADTPEVAKAKVEHFKAVEEQKAKIVAAEQF